MSSVEVQGATYGHSLVDVMGDSDSDEQKLRMRKHRRKYNPDLKYRKTRTYTKNIVVEANPREDYIPSIESIKLLQSSRW